MKVFSLFSGIGAFEKALSRLGVDFELVGYSEIDKFASTAYSAIHGVSEDKNLGDVSKVDIDDLEDFDLMTYGFPCQDISVAGLGKGFSEDSNTRSSLLWEAMRIAEAKKPAYMVAENVKNLVSKRFKNDFHKWLEYLDSIGYNSYWEVLNAKDFGIPQNRERVFVVSIRKDIDKGNFKFLFAPDDEQMSLFSQSNPKEAKLEEVLEKKVREKYYLKDSQLEDLIVNYGKDHVLVKEATKQGYAKAELGDSINYTFPNSKTRRGRIGKGVAQTLDTACNQAVLLKDILEEESEIRDKYYLKQEKVQKIWENFNLDNLERGEVYSCPLKYLDRNQKNLPKDYAMCVDTCNTNGILKVGVNRRYGEWDLRNDNKTTCLDANYHKGIDNHGARTGVAEFRIGASRGRYNEDGSTSQHLELREDKCTNTITTVTKDNLVVGDLKIRKLTPLECWRLMGFDDKDYWKARKALEETYYHGRDRSDSRCYKMAGNSIVVDVLVALFKKLLDQEILQKLVS